jgi:hypothetical protein
VLFSKSRADISVGFWHALFTLDEGNYSVWEIAKYMVNIWFGLDSTGFDISSELILANFHPYLGPVIFFVFACLANTLFITVVVAILSTTFAELNADAKAEVDFMSTPKLTKVHVPGCGRYHRGSQRYVAIAGLR